MFKDPYSLAYLAAERQRELRSKATADRLRGAACPGSGLIAIARRLAKRAFARMPLAVRGLDLSTEEGGHPSSPIEVAP